MLAVVLQQRSRIECGRRAQGAAQIAQSLGEDFDIEIVEGHHHHKVDPPVPARPAAAANSG